MMISLTFVPALALSACGASPAQPPQAAAGATVRVIAPASGTVVHVGDMVDIQGQYDGAGIAELVVRINGVAHATLPASVSSSTFSSQWAAESPGQQIIYVEALDADKKVLARSDVVAVQVNVLTPTPETTQPPEPTLAPTDVMTTSAVEPAVMATTQVTSSPSLTVISDYVNLRAGPGTSYALAGRLNQGQTAVITGKSADGQWWQASVDGKTVWVFGELVEANAAAGGVAVAQAPPSPTAPPATTAPPTATPQAVAVAPTDTPAPTAVPTPSEPVCNAENPFWAAKLNNNPDYTFCTPVPFEFVFNASSDPDEMVIRWNIYGIESLEMRMDPSGDSCGLGSTGFRQQVPFKEDNFRLNRRNFRVGGYKLGLWATLKDGRVQDWGELHFCGTG
jgi:uncharacterized protein YraI